MSVRIVLLLCAAGLAASCAPQAPVVALAPPAAVSPKAARAVVATIALQNAGFEDKPSEGATCAPAWSCAMHADPHSFRFTPLEAGTAAGARSYCVESVGKEPWANLSQALRNVAPVRGMRVRFSAAVKLESVIGKGAGPFIIAQGGSGQTIEHSEALASGERGWQRVEVEMDVPRETMLLEVGMTFIGHGRACLDDARLEVLAPDGPV